MNKRVAQHLRNVAKIQHVGDSKVTRIRYKKLKKLYYERKREGRH